MIYIENPDDIKRAMELPQDDKNIEPEDLVYQEERQEMRFGDEFPR